jgi:hypothetical protein
MQEPRNGKKDSKDEPALVTQTFENAGFAKIGATGLEPATS